MNRLSPVVSVIAVFSLIFAVGYWFLVLPQFREMGQTFTSLDALQKSASIKSTGKESQQQKVADLRAKTNALLPTTNLQYDVAVQIESLASSKQVTLSALSANAVPISSVVPKTTAPQEDDATDTTTATTPEPVTKAPQSVSVSVSVSASYENVRAFITGLTSLDRLIQIDQVIFTRGANGQVSAQIMAYAYYL